MKVVRKVDFSGVPQMTVPGLKILMSVLNAKSVTARMVGGCVRDMLMGREIIDIDLACSLPPVEAMACLTQAGIKVVPTGLKHGTITAVIDGIGYEVTSLRQDVDTDGRHATVAYTDDWAADAARRDFTFNALYLDGDGSLYDPCHGLDDLADRRVRFIGRAGERIREDGLRILRFFRFAAQIGGGEMDVSGRAACLRHKALLDNLSGERLAQELLKILRADYLLPIMKDMVAQDILPHIIGVTPDWSRFERYVLREKALERSDVLARLCSLLPKGSEGQVCSHLRLSNRQTKTVIAYGQQEIDLSKNISKKNIRKLIYIWGREVFSFALLDHNGALALRPAKIAKLLHYVESWPVPQFPLQGRDLIMAGHEPGPKLGEMLQKYESEWIASDFSMSKNDLLNRSE